jgi:arylsulfatase A-like enzyme
MRCGKLVSNAASAAYCDRRSRRTVRHQLPGVWLLLVVASGCVHTREDGAPPPAPPDRPSVARAVDRGPAGSATAREASTPTGPQIAPAPPVTVRYDLAAYVHTAEISRGGLVIDLGTPSATRHTLGGWRTGWGRDRRDGEITWATPGGDRPRLYFGADAPAAGRLRVTGRGGTLRATLNDEPLDAVDLSGGTWRAAEVAFPVRALRAGENTLFLRGSDVRVDKVEIRTDPDSPGAPVAAELLTRAVLGPASGGAEVPALRLPAGTTLSFTLEVPADASLRMAVGATAAGAGATVRVRVARDGAAAEDLLEVPVTAGAPVERRADLARYRGEVVRLDLAAEGPSATEALVVAPRVVVPTAEAESAPERRAPAKNLIIVLVDTLRADKLRPYNPRSRVVAESFERLAREGALFENAATQENWTKPSVATLLTGLYPSSHNTKTDSAVLPAEAETIAEMLRDAGFATAGFIANGYVSERFGFGQGWGHYRNYVREERANKAEFIARDVLEWLDRRDANQRFFLYVHAIDPHVPYSPPVDFIRRYDAGEYSGPVRAARTALLLEDIKTGRFDPSPRDRARLEALYDGEVTYNDERIAAIFDSLEERHLLDDTLVVFTSDHGEEFFDHGSVGHGHSLFRELLHVPLVIRLPGRIPAGLRIGEDVGLVDVVPTALELLGLPIPPVAQGRPLGALLSGRSFDAPRGALSEFLDTQRAVTSGRYKLILRGTAPALYDLASDPHEQHDVAGTHPIALRHMRSLLGALVAGADVPVRGAPRPRRVLARETTTIDPETEAQLRALGYIGTSRPR